jgi:hypothetical protein
MPPNVNTSGIFFLQFVDFAESILCCATPKEKEMYVSARMGTQKTLIIKTQQNSIIIRFIRITSPFNKVEPVRAKK